jgi:hypothetical protein
MIAGSGNAFAQANPLPANQFMATPSGAPGNLAPRTMTSADINAGMTLGGDLAGVFPSPTIALLAVTNAKMAAGAASANVGTLSGVLGGTLPSPTMAAGAASTNIGTLGGSLAGTLPNPTIANSVSLPGSPITTTQANTDNSTKVATTAWDANLKRIRTFQSFGAVGDGVTDDTANVQTALNSGVPISCNGIFNITGLVTITTQSFQIFGGGWHEGQCEFLLNGSSAMFYGASLTSGIFVGNQVVLKDIKITVKQAITAAVGPAQTAAFYLTYPAGVSATIPPTLDVENVRIQGDANGHYILNGFNLNEFQGAYFTGYHYEGNRGGVLPTNGTQYAIVLTGTHQPTTVTVEHSFMDTGGGVVYAPAQTATGWQGIRVRGTDCVGCWIGINVAGSNDGTSDYLDVSGFEGAFYQSMITSTNVIHNILHHNYGFMVNGANPASPNCINASWTITVPGSGSESAIDDNLCNGTGLVTYTGSKSGIVVGGNASANLGVTVGPNVLSNWDIGVLTNAGSSGVLVHKQISKSVTTEWSNLAAAGNNQPVPPLAVVDGSAQTAGLVGEVLRSVNQPGVSLVSGTAKDVTTLALTSGHWSCYGSVDFNPAAGTTISLVEGGINTVANVEPSVLPFSFSLIAGALTTGTGVILPLNTTTYDFSVATTMHLVAVAGFGVSTMNSYGFIECQRTR